jgi:hypothetical protein
MTLTVVTKYIKGFLLPVLHYKFDSKEVKWEHKRLDCIREEWRAEAQALAEDLAKQRGQRVVTVELIFLSNSKIDVPLSGTDQEISERLLREKSVWHSVAPKIEWEGSK